MLQLPLQLQDCLLRIAAAPRCAKEGEGGLGQAMGPEGQASTGIVGGTS